MAFRFFRRMRIAPGVSLNLSKSGGSLSFGPRGAKMTLGPRGVRQTVGLPGTGFYYTKHGGGGRARGSGASRQAAASNAPEVRPEDKLTLGFFTRLFTPKHERAFVDGLKELLQERYDAAYATLAPARQYADGAFLAGVLALKRNALDAASQHFHQAYRRRANLGKLFERYGVAPAFFVSITEHIESLIEANERGVLLVWTETLEQLGRPGEALKRARRLHQHDPGDELARVVMADLLLETEGETKKTWQAIIKLAEGVENESEVHAALLCHRARALRGLGMNEAARDTLTPLLRRAKGRPPGMLRAVRYERALTYEALGHNGRARKDLERIYGEAPDFEDVARRLGLE